MISRKTIRSFDELQIQSQANYNKSTMDSCANMEPQAALRLPVDRRKPPISHQNSQRSSVINLDKNRIRHARRLLPRPLSLPSGFNLMRQLGISNVNDEHEAITNTIDLAEIKQLEDDIYNRKKVPSPSLSNRRKICRLGSKCSKCNHDDNPVAVNQSRVSAASQAIMLLDAWQMEPLLRKYSNPSPQICSLAPNEVIKIKPPYIVNKSNHELTNHKPHLTQSKISEDIDPLPHLLPFEVKRRPIKASSKRQSKSVFQRCISSETTTDEEGDSQTSQNSHLPQHTEETAVRKVSKFKRFIMHRRSLNLSRHNDTPSKVSNHAHTDRLSMAVLPDSTMFKPPSHKEISPIPECSRVGSLRRRQWRSDDDIYETMERRSNDVQRQPRLSGHQEDIDAKLIDLEQMQKQLDQLSADLAKRRHLLVVGRVDPTTEGFVKETTKRHRSPSMLLLFQNQQKRHSIGTTTDLVKTWEYRRRYIQLP